MPHKAERRHHLRQFHAKARLRRAHLTERHPVQILHGLRRPRKRTAVRPDDLQHIAHRKLIPQAQHGVPFRDAHGIVGQIVIYCEDAQKGIEELSLDELLQFSPAFGPDIFSYIDYAAILQKGIKKEML